MKLRIRQFLQMTRVCRSSRTVWNSGWQLSPYTESMSEEGSRGDREGERHTTFIQIKAKRERQSERNK